MWPSLKHVNLLNYIVIYGVRNLVLQAKYSLQVKGNVISLLSTTENYS